MQLFYLYGSFMKLGYWFSLCLLIVELNNHGQITIQTCKHAFFYNIGYMMFGVQRESAKNFPKSNFKHYNWFMTFFKGKY